MSTRNPKCPVNNKNKKQEKSPKKKSYTQKKSEIEKRQKPLFFNGFF